MNLTKVKVANVVNFPVGSFVEASGKTYYIQDTTRLLIPSQRILDSWRPLYVFNTYYVNLTGYKEIGKLGFRAGTIIFSLEDGKYYLIEKNKKRQIVNHDWFDFTGVDRLDAVLASFDEVTLHETGEVLN